MNIVAVETSVLKTILIVEDQVLLAMGLKDELEDVGYRVIELALRHQEALAIAREIKLDLALVNIDLAEDGVALASDLKALGVPVLFTSGQVDRARLGKAMALASLAKQHSAGEMLDAVDHLFRHERGDASRPGPARPEMVDSGSSDHSSPAPESLAEHAHHLIAREKILGEDEGWAPTPDETVAD